MMNSKQFFVFLLGYVLFNLCRASNILLADDLPSPSHQIWNYAIAQELLDRGHHVTMIGPLTKKPPVHQNFTHLNIDDIIEVMGTLDYENAQYLKILKIFQIAGDKFCEATYKSKDFKKLLSYPDNKFDLILIDITMEGCFYPLIQKFGYPPTVGISAFPLAPYIFPHFGNDLQPAFIPSFVTSYTDDMNFIERLFNYFYLYYDMFTRKYYEEGRFDELAAQTFGKNVKSTAELRNYISLFLVNWSPVLHYSQPIAPNTIPVAGNHIKLKPLEKDLQKILDESKNGVILFSLGTNIKSKDLSLKTKQTLLSAFAQLNQTVIWKFESDLNDLPKNVIIRQWIQQNEILAHPNTKLFISHGGGLSVIETTYFGVPILGIPFFGDQHTNIGLLVKKGVARKIDFQSLTTTNFLDNVNEMLNNKEYSTKMNKLSKLMRDEPQTAMERTMFWIEYAIRNNGANLDPKSRHLPLIVSTCMDVKLALLFVTLALSMALFKIVNLFKTKNHRHIKKQKIK